MSFHALKDCNSFPSEQPHAKPLSGADQKRRADVRREQEAPKLARLKKAMAQLGWSQADLARAWGIDATCVSDILRGDMPIGERLEHPGVRALALCWHKLAIEELERGGIVVPILVATARAGTATGQFAAIACEALADGKIDSAEQAKLERAAAGVVDSVKAIRVAK